MRELMNLLMLHRCSINAGDFISFANFHARIELKSNSSLFIDWFIFDSNEQEQQMKFNPSFSGLMEQLKTLFALKLAYWQWQNQIPFASVRLMNVEFYFLFLILVVAPSMDAYATLHRIPQCLEISFSAKRLMKDDDSDEIVFDDAVLNCFHSVPVYMFIYNINKAFDSKIRSPKTLESCA